MIVPFRPTRIALALAGLSLALCAGSAVAGGFALQETSASGLGNAFAGGAAAAEDASTVWSNPAGMSRIGSYQLTAAGHVIVPSFKFNDQGSVAAAFQPLGHNGGDAGTTNLVPNLYFVAPINRQLAFGVGFNVPFGLVTDYGEGWLGRFQGMKSDIKTYNVNPSVSWQVNDAFSIGAGASWQKIDATLTQRINYPAALFQGTLQAGQSQATALQVATATAGLDSGLTIKGNDSAWGWNVGVLWNLDGNSRIGASYRSSIKYHVNGNADISNPTLPPLPSPIAPLVGLVAAGVNANALYSSGVSGDVEVPQMANVSYFRRLDDRWDVMADVQWTGWSSFKTLTFTRSDGKVLGSTPENFDDVWRFSVGANYRYTDQWMFRGGLAYDQGPSNNTDRTVRLPDKDRVWFSLGSQYKLTPQLKFDGAVTYIMATGKASIDQNGGTSSGYVKGEYDVSAWIVGLQATYSF